MPVVDISTALIEDVSSVSLAQYAQIVQLSECGFWGVAGNDLTGSQCKEIWSYFQRKEIAFYLREAQLEIENEIGYPLGEWQWFTDNKVDYLVPGFTKQGYIIEGGIRAETTIQAGAAVSHLTDPAVVGPIATTVLVEYIGASHGKQTFYGNTTGARYVFGLSSPISPVDKRDLYSVPGRRNSKGLLEIQERGKAIFREYKIKRKQVVPVKEVDPVEVEVGETKEVDPIVQVEEIPNPSDLSISEIRKLELSSQGWVDLLNLERGGEEQEGSVEFYHREN